MNFDTYLRTVTCLLDQSDKLEIKWKIFCFLLWSKEEKEIKERINFSSNVPNCSAKISMGVLWTMLKGTQAKIVSEHSDPTEVSELSSSTSKADQTKILHLSYSHAQGILELHANLSYSLSFDWKFILAFCVLFLLSCTSFIPWLYFPSYDCSKSI